MWRGAASAQQQPDRGEDEHLLHHLDTEELLHHFDVEELVHHLDVVELRVHLDVEELRHDELLRLDEQLHHLDIEELRHDELLRLDEQLPHDATNPDATNPNCSASTNSSTMTNILRESMPLVSFGERTFSSNCTLSSNGCRCTVSWNVALSSEHGPKTPAYASKQWSKKSSGIYISSNDSAHK